MDRTGHVLETGIVDLPFLAGDDLALDKAILACQSHDGGLNVALIKICFSADFVRPFVVDHGQQLRRTTQTQIGVGVGERNHAAIITIG